MVADLISIDPLSLPLYIALQIIVRHWNTELYVSLKRKLILGDLLIISTKKRRLMGIFLFILMSVFYR